MAIRGRRRGTPAQRAVNRHVRDFFAGHEVSDEPWAETEPLEQRFDDAAIRYWEADRPSVV